MSANPSTNKSTTGNLKGKRKKPVPSNSNPLFTKWLAEWKDEAAEKGWKSHHTYAKALKTLKLFPLKLDSGKDCKMLQNFGDKICKMLDEKLAEYQQSNNAVDLGIQEKALDTTCETSTKISRKVSTTSKTHVISDNSDSEPEKCESPPKKKRQSKPREYVPAYKSGPYAIVVTLYRYMQDPDFKGFMTKSELCHAAQPLSEKSFTMSDPGSHYTAWSSVSSLIKRGLAQKDGCPARYMLTEAGLELGSKLENVENGSPVVRDQLNSESSISTTSTNNSRRVQHPLRLESSCYTSPMSATERPTFSQGHIMLSDSEEECSEKNNKQGRTNSKDCSESKLPSSDPLHFVPSDSEDECNKEEVQCDRDRLGRLSPTHNPGDNDDPVFIVSDDECDHVNSVKESTFSTGHVRFHSLSPSPSPSPTCMDTDKSPLHQEVDESPTHLIYNRISRNDDNPFQSLHSKENHPSLKKTDGDCEIIGIESDDDDDHVIKLTSEPHISKFSWENEAKDDVIHTVDDDDDLPDLDEYIPLSKRLLAKGVVSSSLLNSHMSHSGNRNLSSDDNQGVKHQVNIASLATTNKALDSKSSQQSKSSGISSYTSIRETTSNRIGVSSRNDPVLSTKVDTKSQNSGSSLISDSYSDINKEIISRTNNPVPIINNIEKVTGGAHQVSSISSVPSSSSTVTYYKLTPAFTFSPGTFDIVLCVDQREFYGSKSNSKTLLPDLIKSGINCDLRHLNISDLVWVAREKSNPANILDSSSRRELVLNYAIERKRMDDLVSSISSGRLKEQKFRLKHCGVSELIILIEEYGSIQNFSLSEDRIKQSIVNSQIIDGFKVKRCGSSKDAIVYLSLITRFLQSHYHTKTLHAVSHEWLKDNKKSSISDTEQYLMPFEVFNEASVKQKTLSVREMFAKHLLQIPGVSLERASEITKVYPSLSMLIEAYKNCSSEKAKESLLASIKCGSKQRNLGIAVSRTVSMMYNSTGHLS